MISRPQFAGAFVVSGTSVFAQTIKFANNRFRVIVAEHNPLETVLASRDSC